jgi:Raf kinase inhibitor-like YbhB/YbcL family protein
MKLTSSAFSNEGEIPREYTCDGDNINPPLTISDIPDSTETLVIIMDDPDVPKTIREDGIWDHWVVFNIPANVRNINKGEEPEGVYGINTSGSLHYVGPCPPDARHRYFFKLFALSSKLDLLEKSTKQQVIASMEEIVLATVELMGTYIRK